MILSANDQVHLSSDDNSLQMIHFMLDDLGNEAAEALLLLFKKDILVAYLDLLIPCRLTNPIQRKASLLRINKCTVLI